jgi:hypothetical protein
MKSYKVDIDSNNLIIQLDSLIHVDVDKYIGGLLILDECTSLINYVRSTTLKNKRIEVVDRLIRLIKNADQVICLDANVSDLVIELMLEIRNTKDYYFYYNTYKPKENVTCYVHEEEATILNNMLYDIKDDVKFVACFDSKSKLEDFNVILQSYIKEHKLKRDFKIYTADEGEELIDTSMWKDCYVMYSPKIIYGIDYSNYEVKTKVYSIACKKLLNPLEIKQQIGRCRNQTELHVFVKDKKSHISYMSEEELVGDIEILLNLGGDIKRELKDACAIRHTMSGFCLDLENIYNKIYVRTEFIDHILKSDMKQCLLKLLENDGYVMEPYVDKEIIEVNEVEVVKKEKEVNEKLITLLCLNKEALSELEKEIVSKPNKYVHHKNTSRMCYTMDEVYKELDMKCHVEMKIEVSKSELMKVIYLRKLNEALGIEELILYNHKRDHVRFNEEINNEWVLKNIDTIKKMFRISSSNYKNFDKKGGYGKLYSMSMIIFKQLCGHELINGEEIKIKHNYNYNRSYEYDINNEKLQDHLTTLLKRKKNGLNTNIIKFLKILDAPKNYFSDDL